MVSTCIIFIFVLSVLFCFICNIRVGLRVIKYLALHYIKLHWIGIGLGLDWDWIGIGIGLNWDWIGLGLGLDWIGISWDFLGFPGISWDFLGFLGISWDFLGKCRCSVGWWSLKPITV